MLMNRSELRTWTYCCALLVLTAIVANRASGVAAMEGQVEDQSSEEMQDWRQPSPTVKRAMSLLNKLVLVAHRTNNRIKPEQKLHHHRQSADANEVNSHYQELEPLKVSTEAHEDDHYLQQKAVPVALPHMGFERRGQKSSRVFWRCYFNAVTCFR